MKNHEILLIEYEWQCRNNQTIHCLKGNVLPIDDFFSSFTLILCPMLLEWCFVCVLTLTLNNISYFDVAYPNWGLKPKSKMYTAQYASNNGFSIPTHTRKKEAHRRERKRLNPNNWIWMAGKIKKGRRNTLTHTHNICNNTATKCKTEENLICSKACNNACMWLDFSRIAPIKKRAHTRRRRRQPYLHVNCINFIKSTGKSRRDSERLSGEREREKERWQTFHKRLGVTNAR